MTMSLMTMSFPFPSTNLKSALSFPIFVRYAMVSPLQLKFPGYPLLSSFSDTISPFKSVSIKLTILFSSVERIKILPDSLQIKGAD